MTLAVRDLLVEHIEGRDRPARPAATVVFCGGGTGGHLTPGLSVARTIAAERPNTRIVFLLTGRAAEAPFLAPNCGATAPSPFQGEGGGEGEGLLRGRGRGPSPSPLPEGEREGDAGGASITPEGGCATFERHVVPAVRWPRGLRDLAAFPVRWLAVRRSGRRWIERLEPDAVVGLGGYGQYGPLAAAQRRGLPTVLLEQNALPGKSNRLLARGATDVCCQWEAARPFFPAGAPVRVTGNPIRESILRGSADGARERFGLAPGRKTLLVLGGSQGSRRLNQALMAAARLAPGWAPLFGAQGTWQIVHQSGPEDGDVRATYAALGLPHAVVPFLDELAMADALAAADLAVSRAGATTLAELTAVSLPAVLFPLPARDGHQDCNAEVLAAAGAARIVTDTGDAAASGAELARVLCEVCSRPEELAEMAQGSRRLGVRDAAHRVAEVVLKRAAERVANR